jgi:Holliday junction DNA helicase RuvB
MSVKSFCPQQENTPDSFDSTLRPQDWSSYIGQEGIKRNLKIIIGASKKRRDNPDHLLFYGPAGLGKTTLAYLTAKEAGANLKTASAPIIEKPGDLVALLTNLNEGDFLFIDECHRLNRSIEEYLYSAMEDFKLSLILGKGPMAKTLELDIPHFTLVGATTRLDLLSSPLRSRFGAIFQLKFYEPSEVEEIIRRSAKILKIKISEGAVKELSKRSRFTPRIANKLLKRVRDFTQMEDKDLITEDISKKLSTF